MCVYICIPYHDVQIAVIPSPQDGHAPPGPKPVLYEHIGMKLGEQSEQKSLSGGGVEGVVAVHVHSWGVHW